MTDWNELGGDPSPGNVSVLIEQASALNKIAENGRRTESQLRALHAGMGELTWTGAGATHIAGLVEDSLPQLIHFWSSHTDAARALNTFISSVQDLQQRAGAAGIAYENASAAAAAAQSDLGGASSRKRDAGARVTILTAQIAALDVEIGALRAMHQSTAAQDAQSASLHRTLVRQNGVAADAATAKMAARARVDSAKADQSHAKKTIEDIRAEFRQNAASARTAILSTVGIVESTNTLIKAWTSSTRAVEGGGHWLDQNMSALLHSVDDVQGWLGIAAVILAPVPVVGEILGVAVVTLAAISLVGHLYLAANGRGNWGDVAWNAVSLIPLAGVLGRMGKVGAKEFEHNLPGLVKRFRWLENASHGTGQFSSRGVKILGHNTILGKPVYRVHVVPKLGTRTPFIQRTILGAKIAQDMLLDGKEAKDQVTGWFDFITGKSNLPPATPELSSDRHPVTVLQIAPNR